MNSNENPQPLTFGPMTPFEIGDPEFTTPSYIEIGTRIFYWHAQLGCYRDIIGVDLYIEPGLNDLNQTLTQDSYWEYN